MGAAALLAVKGEVKQTALTSHGPTQSHTSAQEQVELGTDEERARHVSQLAPSRLRLGMRELASVPGPVPGEWCCWVGGRGPSHQLNRKMTAPRGSDQRACLTTRVTAEERSRTWVPVRDGDIVSGELLCSSGKSNSCRVKLEREGFW